MRRVGGDTREREYERHRQAVLGMLAKRFPRLDADERLSLYHDSWARVYAKRERGEKVVSLRAYLIATASAEALHLVSRSRAPTPVGPDDPRLAGLADGAEPLDEQVVRRDQARIARGLLDTLDERQRNVLKLRWDLQLSGAEVRAALGLSMRQYRRLAEEGSTALAERVEQLENGHWSRRTRSLLIACLVEVTCDGERRVGIASKRQREEAQRLLESDPHVAALYAEVRRSVRGAAALLPMPVLTFESADPLARIAELTSAARSHFTHAIETSKQQATSLYIRAADPTLLSGGPRPGATAAAVAGALALGGGAYGTYEAVSSTPEPAPIPAGAPKAAAPPPPTRAQLTPQPNPPPKPRKPQPSPQPQPPPPAQAPAPPPPRPQPTTPTNPTEFGFEN